MPVYIFPRVAVSAGMAMIVLLIGPVALAAGEWQSLFDGKSLAGWKAIDGPQDSWGADGGVLYTTGKGGGWLSTEKEYGDFEVKLEFNVPPGGNSGVFLRAPHKGNPAFEGMEIQVLDDAAKEYAKLEPYQYCGSLYDVAAAHPRAAKPAGQWQQMHIVCQGRKVKVTLNDQPIIDADLDAHPGKVPTHPGLKRAAGHVGLQNHGNRVEFRNVQIREL